MTRPQPPRNEYRAHWCWLRTLIAIVLIVIGPANVLAATVDWTGEWDTRWRGGGARLTLTQEGDRVEGVYPLYDGRISAIASGRELRGSWSYGNASGEFVAIQSPDGESFAARLGNAEWWTGLRVADDGKALGIALDQSSPASTMYYFLLIMNALGPGTMELKSEASFLIDWGALERRTISRLDYTRLLYTALDRLTFRPWDLQRSPDGQNYAAVLQQAGTDNFLILRFQKVDGKWFIIPPATEILQEKVREFNAARNAIDTRKVEGFQSARDTIRTLMTRFDESNPKSVDKVRDALNMSQLSDIAKTHEAARLASYLKRTLDRLETPIWQEITDDPGSRTPHVHFEHPLGDITLAPVETERGTVWQFTPDTLHKIRALYTGISDLPPTAHTQHLASKPNAYFLIRDYFANHHPNLMRSVGPMVAWQWLGLLLSLAIAYVLGRVISLWVGGPILQRFHKNLADYPVYRGALVWATRLFFLGITLRVMDEPLGLPDAVEVFVLTVSWSTIILSVAIFLLIFVSLFSERIAHSRTVGGHNITLVSLAAGVIRIVIVVSAILLLADVLEIPYQGVLAGLGIGGLAVALAAQSTLQNFISGITLYFDKPVAIGDYCRFGDYEGTVEFIGMRSTRIRTRDRTLVTIPNSEFSNMKIENYAKRDRMFLNTKLQVRYETTPDQLRYLLAEIRKLLIAHPKVAADPMRVRLSEFGSHSLNIEIFAYLLTNSRAEFTAIREDIFLRIMSLIKETGAQFAFPSVVHYEAKDTPIDREKTQTAEAAVAQWREQGNLPFPDFAWQDKAEISQTLDYPPDGSAVKAEYAPDTKNSNK